MSRPLVLIHGYSSDGSAFAAWRGIFRDAGYSADRVHSVSYASLTDEVTIPDIAEGFDKVLAGTPGLGNGEPFDAVVHSTGMLVLRAWLAADPARRLPRLKHLVALAPATNGSPQAHKGRSFLGAIVKGNRQFGPDFLEAGKRVLDALELGSRFTWDLAHADLFGDTPFYKDGPSRPYVAIFCGDSGYTGVASVVNEAGTDGTVRWAGAALNSRKLTVDLSDPAKPQALTPHYGTQDDVPVYLVPGVHHGTILSAPTVPLARHVIDFLTVSTSDGFVDWMAETEAEFGPTREAVDPFQQFVVRLRDERGAPVEDWNLQFQKDGGDFVDGFAAKVHVYSGDPSLRCFHVNLHDLGDPHEHLDGALLMRLVASTGTRRVEYAGTDYQQTPPKTVLGNGGQFALTLRVPTRPRPDFTLFYPFTTTLLDLIINRESLVGRDKVIALDPTPT
ncbi:MAG: hypothetical protein SFW08_03315 [Gemmatimonadaceae bacterium]|nr:hypothetical protein [Gemmatimonadaceae bacterium]